MATAAAPAAPCFDSFPLLKHDGASPQAIGGNHGGVAVGSAAAAAAVSAAGCGSVPQQHTSSAGQEVARLRKEYDFEAGLISEQLELCGVQRELLSARARLSLGVLAAVASALQLREARPELVLAAWAVLSAREIKLAGVQHSLQQETLELERRRNVTQAKLRAMQAALAETLSQQARYAEVIAKEEAAAPAQAEKAKTYEGMWKKLQRRLTERGLTPELTHGALVTHSERVEELRARLASLQTRLDGYHNLPPSLLGARMMLQQATARLQDKQAALQARLADEP